MDRSFVLKALADERRMQILTLLLEGSYCVRALAGQLGITQAAVSQHLKVLRDAGLVQGRKRGYFTHYDVQREVLHELAQELEALAAREQSPCALDRDGCGEGGHGHERTTCTEGQKAACHGHGHSHGGPCRCRHQEEEVTAP